MFLLLIIIALRDVRVHIDIDISDSGNVAPYVKTSVNKTFSFTTTLDVSYVDLNDSYI